jgi:signal transduction histidine kinase
MQERAQLFGGEVHISGAPGKGTTVSVRIPLPAVPSVEGRS